MNADLQVPVGLILAMVCLVAAWCGEQEIRAKEERRKKPGKALVEWLRRGTPEK